jgi:hypothetical protein
MATSESSSESTLQGNTKRKLVIAFIVGAIVHAVLLGLSLFGVFDMATWLLLVFALPGAMVDMSAEMIHPSRMGGVVLAVVATVVNGGVYALGAWIVSKIKRRA